LSEPPREPLPVQPLAYEAEGAAPGVSSFAIAVIAVRFLALQQLLSSQWWVSNVVQTFFNALRGIAWDRGAMVSQTIGALFPTITAIALWLFAHPIARKMTPRSTGDRLSDGGGFAQIGIALLGVYTMLAGVSTLQNAAGVWIQNWIGKPVGYFWLYPGAEVSAAIAAAQLLLGLLLLLNARRLARLRPFRSA
jgi:hypothetical protein